MPNTSIPQNLSQVVDIVVMTSIAGAPAQVDTTSNVSWSLSQGFGIVTITPPPNTPSQARQLTIHPQQVGQFQITVFGPYGSQSVINGEVTAVANSSTLTLTLNPPA